jgi:hypothetical protein
MAGRGGSDVTARGGATSGGFERSTAGTLDDRGIECFFDAIFGGAGRLRMLPARDGRGAGRGAGPFFFMGHQRQELRGGIGDIAFGLVSRNTLT